MNLKYLAGVGLLAIGVGAVGVVTVVGTPGGTSSVTYQTSQATTTNVTESAVASGSLVAATTYSLSFGSAPKSTSASASPSTSSTSSAASGGTGSATWPVTAVNVVLGDVVKAGDVLAVADDASAQLQLEIAKADLAAAKSKLKTDEAGADATTRAAAKDSVTQAATQLAQARQSYADTVRQNNLSVSRATTAVKTAHAQLAADTKAGAPSQTIAADRAAVTQAKQNLAQTKAQVAASNHQAANQVTNAAHNLTSAKHNYATQVAPASAAQIATDESAVATAEAALATAESAVANSTLSAPIDGRITAVNIAVGSEASGVAIELQSTQLAVTASFTEDDIVNLQVGQAATVTVSATGATVTGKVWQINPTASGTAGSSVVSYKVTILLDSTSTSASSASGSTATTGTPVTAAATASPSPSASPSTASPLPGMSAEVDVTIAEARNVVAIPAIALSGTSGSYTVRIIGSDGSPVARSVEVGLVTTSLAEIRSGLAAGDTVVTGSSSDKTTTTGSSSSNNSNSFNGPQNGFPGGVPPVGPGGQ